METAAKQIYSVLLDFPKRNLISPISRQSRKQRIDPHQQRIIDRQPSSKRRSHKHDAQRHDISKHPSRYLPNLIQRHLQELHHQQRKRRRTGDSRQIRPRKRSGSPTSTPGTSITALPVLAIGADVAASVIPVIGISMTTANTNTINPTYLLSMIHSSFLPTSSGLSGSPSISFS